MKRTLAIILSVAMLFTALPFAAFAEQNVCAHEGEYTWLYEKVADCTAAGCTINRKKLCSDCGEVYGETETISAQKEHILTALPLYDENGNIIEANYIRPTCEETGMQKYACMLCETTVEKVIPANGHSYGEREVYVKCFDPEDSSNQVSRTENGIYRSYCTEPGCKAYLEERINDHVHFGYEAKEADCFGPGHTAFTYCITCATETEVYETPQLEHKDENDDGRCDLCFSEYRGDGVFCSCLCHSEKPFMQLLMPLFKLIWQLLGIDNCHGTCDAVHYVKE